MKPRLMHARTPSEAPPPRMAALARLPVFFALEGRRALVAGGTPAAAWKAELLSAAGAAVDVYAPEPCDELLALAADPPRGPVVMHGAGMAGRRFRRRCASRSAPARTTRRPSALPRAARAAGVPVNVIDKPAFCDFAFGAIVNRSPLVIGISTDGAAPVFAQAIRAKLEALIPRGFARWAEAARRWRRDGAGVRAVVRRRAGSSGSCSPRTPATHPDQRAAAGRLRPPAGRDARPKAPAAEQRLGHAGRRRSRRSGTADAARGARAAIGRRHPVRRSGVARRCSTSRAARRRRCWSARPATGRPASRTRSTR